jgi:hypothetical protein
MYKLSLVITSCDDPDDDDDGYNPWHEYPDGEQPTEPSNPVD